MEIIGYIGVVIVGIAGLLFGYRRLVLNNLRQNLRTKLLHNEDQINRLLELERSNNPKGSEIDHYKAAIIKWERFNK